MADLKQINEALNFYLRPQTFPVAVRMCASGEELPEKVRIPDRDLGFSVSVCHAVAMTRRYGWTIAVGEEQTCWVAGLSMGFLPLKPDVVDGSFQESLGLWGQSKEMAAATVQNLNKFEYGTYRYALMAPVHRATFEPHVILVYGNPAQIWVLLSGYLAGEGQRGLNVTLSAGAGCSTYITKAINTDECQFALVGTGERLIPHAQDHECAFSVPMSKMDKAIQGMEAGYKVGVFRYPVPTFLRYGSQHPPGYDKMLEHLKG